MVIGIIGESCTGKSVLADRLKPLLDAQVYSGNDYLRLAANEAIARKLFQKKLSEAMSGGNIIYVISESEHLVLLPDAAVRVLVTADLALIKERFSARMGGNLPAPVAAMLERKHGCFDDVPHQLHVVSGGNDLDEVCAAIAGIVS
ncbi:MAG: hypothetical protein Q4B99_03075 [Clostridia bacterium]|nr:hypothetical protein [Clostridia bacterium]